MIYVKNITFSYGQGELLLNIPEFKILRNKINALIGLNGAGKTTLLKILSGHLVSPTMIPQSIAKEIEGDVLFAPEAPLIFEYLTGRQYVQYILELHNLSFLQHLNLYQELVEGFCLHNHENKVFATYSTGIKKKFFLIPYFLLRPKLLIFDEPINGLDYVSIEFFKKLIRNYLLEDAQHTIIITSHIVEFLKGFADHISFIEYGILRERMPDPYAGSAVSDI